MQRQVEALPQAAGHRTSWWRAGILFILFGMMTQSSLGGFVFSTMGPPIVADLQLSASKLGLLASAAFLGSVLMNLPAGLIVDRLGVRRSILISAGIIATSLLLGSFAPSYWFVALGSLCVGCGIAFIQPITNKAVMVWIPPRLWATAVSLKQSGIPGGTALQAAFLTSYTIAHGWRLGFQILGSIALVWGLTAAFCYRERPPWEPEAPRHPAGAGYRPGLAASLGMLKEPGILGSCFIGFTLGVLTLAIQTFFLPYLRDVLRVPLADAVRSLALLNIVTMLARPAIGWVCDRFFAGGRWRGLVWLTVLAAAMAYLLAALTGPLAPVTLTVIVILVGIVSLSWSGVYFTVVAELAGPMRAGSSSGLAALANSLGTSAGPIIFGLILDLTHSYSIGLVAYSTLTLLSGFALMALVRRTVARNQVA